jgi:hypothetical protein
MWTLTLVSCWTPTETGPNGMVADIVDAAGKPVAGADVNTLEEHLVSDENGRVAIAYKPPEQYVDVTVQGAMYRRPYRPEDDGKIVRIQLPDRADVRFACAPKSACERPRLAWDLGDLTAHADPGCEKPTVLVGVPAKVPSLTCGSGGGVLTVADGLWMVEAAPKSVRIDIRGEEGRDPASCDVRVGGEPVSGPPWVAQVSGVASVTAICDGRPALPKTVTDDDAVTLEWSPTGATLDLSRAGAAATPLTIVLEGEKGFNLTVPADPSGRWALPPLPAGRYRLTNGDPAGLALIRPPPDATADEIHVLSSKDGTITGILVLTLPLEDGSPPVAAR